jgi:serine/threonine-protein kinase
MLAVSSTPPAPSAQRDPALELPRTFGRYTLFELIGKGGMAQIYLARAETELGATRLAVVKQILPTFADDPRFAEMLTHEAKLAARLSHKHIVQVFDLGREGQDLYIAMEYVEGVDLNALLKMCTREKVGLPAPHALGIVVDVLEGLDYAHRRVDDEGKPLGIVHRDVSPSNVLISHDGEVKLCDFGIAHANDLVKSDDASEALKGKAGYMSPEHARGEALDARSDVFAAGIILWELLAGRRLYSSSRSELPLLAQARAAEIPPLPDKGLPDMDRLSAILMKALARDRDERYPSAAAFGRDLEAYLGATGQLASRLELGKWIVSTFGTDVVQQRRESERKLPKSQPPPRSSERMRASAAASSAVIPSAPPVPAEPAPPVPAEPAPSPPAATSSSSSSSRVPPAPPESAMVARAPRALPVSDGAIRAFRREVESIRPLVATPADAIRLSLEPGSLAGASIDVVGSSQTAVDPAATGRDSTTDLARPKPADLAPRGGVPVAAALAIAIAAALGLIALARLLVQ